MAHYNLNIRSVSDLYEAILCFYSELQQSDLSTIAPEVTVDIIQRIRILLRGAFPPEWISEVFKRLQEQSLIEDFRALFQRLESHVELNLAQAVVG